MEKVDSMQEHMGLNTEMEAKKEPERPARDETHCNRNEELFLMRLLVDDTAEERISEFNRHIQT